MHFTKVEFSFIKELRQKLSFAIKHVCDEQVKKNPTEIRNNKNDVERLAA